MNTVRIVTGSLAAAFLVVIAGCAAPTEGDAPNVPASALGEETLTVNGWSTTALSPQSNGSGGIRSRATFSNDTAVSGQRRGGMCIVRLSASPAVCSVDADCGATGYCLTQEGSGVAKGCFEKVSADSCLTGQLLSLGAGASTNIGLNDYVSQYGSGWYYTMTVLSSDTSFQCGSHATQQDPTRCVRSLSNAAYVTLNCPTC